MRAGTQCTISVPRITFLNVTFPMMLLTVMSTLSRFATGFAVWALSGPTSHHRRQSTYTAVFPIVNVVGGFSISNSVSVSTCYCPNFCTHRFLKHNNFISKRSLFIEISVHFTSAGARATF